MTETCISTYLNNLKYFKFNIFLLMREMLIENIIYVLYSIKNLENVIINFELIEARILITEVLNNHLIFYSEGFRRYSWYLSNILQSNISRNVLNIVC